METEKIIIWTIIYLAMGVLFWAEIKSRNDVLKRMGDETGYREAKLWKSMLLWFPAVFFARGDTKIANWYFKK